MAVWHSSGKRSPRYERAQFAGASGKKRADTGLDLALLLSPPDRLPFQHQIAECFAGRRGRNRAPAATA